MAAQKGEEERKRALRLKGIRWPVHMCAHTTVLLLQSNRHRPFLLLMHHFLFSGYLLLIYFAALPAMKERAGEPVPPSFSASHTFCTLSASYFISSLWYFLPPFNLLNCTPRCPSPLCLSYHIFYLFGFHFFLFSFPAPLLHLWLTNYITAPHFDKPFLNSLASFLQSNQTPSVLMIRQPQIFFSALPLSALLFHYLTPHFIYPSGLSGEAIRTETRHWLNSLCTITSALCV